MRDASAGEQRIETRILERETDGFREGTYVWNDAQDDAICSGGTGYSFSVSFHPLSLFSSSNQKK